VALFISQTAGVQHIGRSLSPCPRTLTCNQTAMQLQSAV